MKTVKEILTENRETVISSIKFIFKVYSKKEIKTKMIELLEYAKENPANFLRADESKNTKTILKSLISKMAYNQQKKDFKSKSSLRDTMGKISESYEEKGKVWNPLKKDYVYA